MHDAGSSPPRIPRGVWALGFVSLFMDTSSELVHSLLPVFLVSALGASMTSVGLIEGLAEAVGRLWDRFGPLGTFTAGAVFSLISLVGLVAIGRTAETRKPWCQPFNGSLLLYRRAGLSPLPVAEQTWRSS